ncbi:MAG: cobalamin-binding protein, partial [Candidatus Nanohaloarchaea archaeon]|nr:cobalamin-binding protein [Candidatus Nanohaloarchaea archaeon]
HGVEAVRSMNARRIVSLSPSNTEILYELGVQEQVVATTAVCDEPAAAREKPSVGGWTNPDIEDVASHDPDLVLASDELQDRAVKLCEEAGLPVKQLTPTTLQDVFNTVKQVGELVDAEERARDVVDTMNDRVRDAAVLPEQRPRVYCEEWHDPPMAGGNWVPGMVRLAGGEPFLEGGERSRPVSADELQAFDPEHIVIHYCGFGDAADTGRVREREEWADIGAVEEGNVHVVDDALLNRPGPRLVDGVERLAELLHGSEQSRT